jgi:hypothetical protein
VSDLPALPEFAAIDAPPARLTNHFGDLDLDLWRAQLDTRLEVISEALSTGRLKTKRQIAAVAKRLNVKPLHVKLWISDPKVLKRAAQYAVAEALPYQAEKAKENLGAFKALQGQAGLVETGTKVQTNVAIDARTRGDTESDRKFFEQYRKRVESAVEQPTS